MFKLISSKNFLENQSSIYKELGESDKLIIVSDYFNKIKSLEDTSLVDCSKTIIIGSDFSKLEIPRFSIFKFEDAIVSELPIYRDVLVKKRLFNIFSSNEVGSPYRIERTNSTFVVKVERDIKFFNIAASTKPLTKTEIKSMIDDS